MTKKQNRSVRARRAAYRSQQKRQRILIGLGVVGVVLVVVALILVVQPPDTTAADVTLPDTLEAPPNAEGKAWGPADAPVLIEEFSDFQ